MRVRRKVEVPNLGRKIRHARLYETPLGVGGEKKSVQRLATEAGVSIGTWYAIEKEAYDSVDYEKIKSIETVLCVDLGIDALFSEQSTNCCCGFRSVIQ